MNISKSFGKLARGVFTATAFGVVASMVPAAASAWTVGWQGGGSDSFSYIELDDMNGNSFQVRIAPEEKSAEFKSDAIRVMKDYVSWKDLTAMSDQDAAGFLFVVYLLANNTGMSEEDFRSEIGLDQIVYDNLSYQEERYGVLSARASIVNSAFETNVWYANQRLGYSDEHLRKANAALAAARQKHPHEKAFHLAPLSEKDLRNIRVNAAWLNASFFLDLFRRIDSGVSDPKMLGRKDINQLFQTVRLLYRDIQKDPAQARHDSDIVAGNKYNKEIPVLMEGYIRGQGMNPEDFYRRLIDLHNYYDRRSHIDPKPPATPSFEGAGIPANQPVHKP